MKQGLAILFVFLSLIGFSQNDTPAAYNYGGKQHFIISGTGGYGTILPTNPFVKGDNLLGEPMERYRFASVKALWQNPGYTDWQKIYKGPYYGFGISLGDFFNPDEVGYPVSTYGVLGIPIIRFRRLEAFSEFQFGIASNWKKYDPDKNPYNIVIGGGLTVHLDIAMKMHYNLNLSSIN